MDPESEPLIATLATDSVIGAMCSPSTPGSGYVLLHHVMGVIEGHRGIWAYVEGIEGVNGMLRAHFQAAWAGFRMHWRQLLANMESRY